MDYLQTILGLFSTTLNNPLIIYKPYITLLLLLLSFFGLTPKKKRKRTIQKQKWFNTSCYLIKIAVEEFCSIFCEAI